MTTIRTVTLRNIAVEITAEKRQAILEEMPEIAWIGDEALRLGIIDTWIVALAHSSFSTISEIKPSGRFDSRPLRDGTQADHMRSVTRIALKLAEELSGLMPTFSYDRDILIAGCMCHDIGKMWEFDPDNVRRWNATPRKAGLPSLRHPAFGVYITLAMGLPEEIAHMAGCHSAEGEGLVRSLENTILHWADHSFWRIVEAGNQFVTQDPWLGDIPPAVIIKSR